MRGSVIKQEFVEINQAARNEDSEAAICPVKTNHKWKGKALVTIAPLNKSNLSSSNYQMH